MIKRNISIAATITLVAIFLILIYISKPNHLGIQWNDENLYYTVARNIFSNLNFNSNHYLSESILKVGYPTKDTHSPGFPALIALSFLIGGVSETTPFYLNYFCLFLTLISIYFIGKKLKSRTLGLASCLLYISFPLTLVMAHSIMTETTASTAITMSIALLIINNEGYKKGCLLAMLTTLAYLIKPLLGSIIIAHICYVSVKRNPGWQRTLLSLTLAFVAIFLFFVHPLSSNQEFYPSPITEFFSQPTLHKKIIQGVTNLVSNYNQLTFLNWNTGEGKTTISFGLLITGSLISLFFRRSLNKKHFIDSSIIMSVFISFFISLSSVFIIWEYISWRGPRALAAFIPIFCVLFLIAIFDILKLFIKFYPVYKVLTCLITALFCIYFYRSAQIASNDLKSSQSIQSIYFHNTASRVLSVINLYKLHPKMVMSAGNFYLAVIDYPTQVIWTLPRTVYDLEKISERTPLDLIELKDTDTLFQDNLRINKNSDQLGSNYHLIYFREGYFYYLKTTKSS